MNMIAETDFIVTTTNGTKWAETGASMGEVRRKFWGKKVGMTIASVKQGRLFSKEEEAETDREKAIWRSRQAVKIDFFNKKTQKNRKNGIFF